MRARPPSRAGAARAAACALAASLRQRRRRRGLHAASHPPRRSPSPRALTPARLLDWPEFGLDPQRSDVERSWPPGSPRANVGAPAPHHASRCPGTVDSSPIYLHGALVGGAAPRRDRRHDHATARRSRSTPTAGGSCGRSPRPATAAGPAARRSPTASPLADPGRRFVYAASPERADPQARARRRQRGPPRRWPVQRHARRHAREARRRAEHRRRRRARRDQRLPRRRAALPGPRRR